MTSQKAKLALLELAERLEAATDKESWDTAAALLEEVNVILHAPDSLKTYDKATLERVLSSVQMALKDTERRHNEIGTLVRALGGTTTSSV